jgi:hypothetical protein
MILPQIGEVHHLRNASSKVHSSLYGQPSFQSLYTVVMYRTFIKKW